jgi:hypothetical protein
MGRFLNRNDEFRIRLGGLHPQPATGGRLQLGRRTSHFSTRPAAVGLHLPRATASSGGSAGVGIVKAKYVPTSRASGLTQYLQKDTPEASERLTSYIGREGAGPAGQHAELFNGHGPVSEQEREAFVARSRHDPRLWHLIVSPPHAAELDMPLFVRRLMEQFAADTSITPDYLASIHRDSAHVHSHFLIRGRDRENHEFRLDRDYLSHGLRMRTEHIANRQVQLGLVREAMREEVTAIRRSRVVSHDQAHERIQDALTKWREGHANAWAGRQRTEDHGIGI